MKLTQSLLALLFIGVIGAALYIFGACAAPLEKPERKPAQVTRTAPTPMEIHRQECLGMIDRLERQRCTTPVAGFVNRAALYSTCVNEGVSGCLVDANSCQDLKVCRGIEPEVKPEPQAEPEPDPPPKVATVPEAIKVARMSLEFLRQGVEHELEQRAAEEAEEQAFQKRLKRIGAAGQWHKACGEIDRLYASECGSEQSQYDYRMCQDRLRKHIAKRPVFFLDDVYWNLDYDARSKRFKVEVPGYMYGRFVDEDCLINQCGGRGVFARKFSLGGPKVRGHRYEWIARWKTALRDVLTPIKTFTVSAKELEHPEDFEDGLQVDALVRVVAHNTTSVSDWIAVDGIQVQVIGLRAYTKDYTWGRLLIRAPPVKRCVLGDDW